MEKIVIFTAPLSFDGNDGKRVCMSEVFVPVSGGGLAGGLYTTLPVNIGDTVIIDLVAKDGKARAKIVEVKSKSTKPNI